MKTTMLLALTLLLHSGGALAGESTCVPVTMET